MKTLVTGGGGFLGGRIAEMLAERGRDVVILGRNRYPHMENQGFKTLQADIRDHEAMERACHEVDTVFHVAALPGIWGRREIYYDINVRGTEVVIEACRRRGVARLIYTSSPSVALSERSARGVDESIGYPDVYLNPYSETKALAERRVLDANDRNIKTVALRPHLIWGPGDPHLWPRIVERAKKRRLRQVGDGRNLVDVTYIDNAAHAHLLAAEELSGAARCAGKAYFISQGEPVRLWSWINDVLQALGVPPVTRVMSHARAYRAGAALERLYKLLRIPSEPPMTRFLSNQLAQDHYFNLSAARTDLGYHPLVATREGTRKLIAWLKTTA